MQKCVESACELVVARGEASKLFEAIEESLDKISGLVAVPVDRSLCRAIAARRNDGLSACGFNRFDQLVAVVTLIGDNSVGRDGCNQRTPLRHIGDLSTGENQAQRITEGVDTRMNLGRQPAPRASDRLIATVFLGAPAAC